MKLSIVATLYQSAPYIVEFHQRASAAAKQLVGEDYEIIFVNDGSPDNSLGVATKLIENDSHVVVVDLSRNFGHHKAMMSGLEHACGEYVFLIDSDLEEKPEWLLSFYEQLKRKCCDVVYGVQEKRKGGLIERWFGHWFYNSFNTIAQIALPRNLVTARLMTQRYVKALLLHDERELCFSCLCVTTGFNQESQVIRKSDTSRTTYTVYHKISNLVNAITSFSSAPLVAIFYVGLVIFLLAGAFVVYLIVNLVFFSQPLSGWTSVIASIWLIGGLITLFIGIVGIYLSKIFIETKRRPYTIVKEVYQTKN